MLHCSYETSFRLLQRQTQQLHLGKVMMWVDDAIVKSTTHDSPSPNTGMMIATADCTSASSQQSGDAVQ